MTKASAVARLPFLKGLPSKTIAAVNRVLKPLSVPSGTVLFRTGETGDACYFVERGSLSVTNLPGGDVLATLHDGSFVGELALLLGEPRTATVTALTDTQLLELRRADLERLTATHNDLSLAIMRELGRRIVHTNTRLVGDFGHQRVVVWPAANAEPLAQAIRSRGHRVGVTKLQGAGRDDGLPKGLTTLIYVAPHAVPSRAALKNVATVDHVLSFGSPPPWLAEAATPHRMVRLDDTPLGMRRAVRWATGRAVGLVLSSGGSKTVAHLGVLRVLNAAGIEFDAVAGSSGGSIAAVGIAFGRGEDYLHRAIADVARLTKYRRLDFNVVPRSGLAKGKRLRDCFSKWDIGANLEDGSVPVWLVGSDVATGEAVIMSRGPSADAIRASLSVPGAFDPWRHGDNLLIDGAIANPLPTDVLRNAGVGIVLASNVAGQPSEVAVDGKLPPLPQVMSRVLNTMERERIKSLAPLADVVISPKVSAASTFDFSNIEPTIEAGVAAAEARIGDIRRLLRAASDLTSVHDPALHS